MNKTTNMIKSEELNVNDLIRKIEIYKKVIDSCLKDRDRIIEQNCKLEYELIRLQQIRLQQIRTKEEIEAKIDELYKLQKEGKRDSLRVIIEADALSWVLGDDYLETKIMIGDKEENGEDKM